MLNKRLSEIPKNTVEKPPQPIGLTISKSAKVIEGPFGYFGSLTTIEKMSINYILLPSC
jgi:hypothetical protein